MALDEVARENLRRELRPASPSNASITVETRVSNLLPSGDDDSYVRGGGTLSTCTAGFTVRHRVTEELGVATAHHCADSAQRLYSNHSVDGGSALVNRKVRGNTNYGDVAWYDDGAFVASLQFYYNWNAKRYVTAVWSPRTGVDACKFGKTTGVTCDTTYELNTTRGSSRVSWLPIATRRTVATAEVPGTGAARPTESIPATRTSPPSRGTSSLRRPTCPVR